MVIPVELTVVMSSPASPPSIATAAVTASTSTAAAAAITNNDNNSSSTANISSNNNASNHTNTTDTKTNANVTTISSSSSSSGSRSSSSGSTISSSSVSSRARAKGGNTHKNNQRRSAFDDDDDVDDDISDDEESSDVIVDETQGQGQGSAALLQDDSTAILDSSKPGDSTTTASSSLHPPVHDGSNAAVIDQERLAVPHPPSQSLSLPPVDVDPHQQKSSTTTNQPNAGIVGTVGDGWIWRWSCVVGFVTVVVFLGRYVVFSLFFATQRPVSKRSRHGHRQRNKVEKMSVVESLPKTDEGVGNAATEGKLSLSNDVASPATDTTTTSSTTTADDDVQGNEVIVQESLLSSPASSSSSIIGDQRYVVPATPDAVAVSVQSPLRNTPAIIAPPSYVSSPHHQLGHAEEVMSISSHAPKVTSFSSPSFDSSSLLSPPRHHTNPDDAQPIVAAVAVMPGSPCLGGMDIIERTILADLAWASSSSASAPSKSIDKTLSQSQPLSQSLFAMSPLDDDTNNHPPFTDRRIPPSYISPSSTPTFLPSTPLRGLHSHDMISNNNNNHQQPPPPFASFTLPWLSSPGQDVLGLSPLGVGGGVGRWPDLVPPVVVGGGGGTGGGYGNDGLHQAMMMMGMGMGMTSPSMVGGGGGVGGEEDSRESQHHHVFEGFDVDLTVDLDTSQDYDYHHPISGAYDENNSNHHDNNSGSVEMDGGGISSPEGIQSAVGVVSNPKGRPSYPPGLVRREK